MADRRPQLTAHRGGRWGKPPSAVYPSPHVRAACHARVVARRHAGTGCVCDFCFRAARDEAAADEVRLAVLQERMIAVELGVYAHGDGRSEPVALTIDGVTYDIDVEAAQALRDSLGWALDRLRR